MLDPRELLVHVSAPVLVVGGARDIQIDRQDFDRLVSVCTASTQALWIGDMAHSLKSSLPTDASPLDAYMRDRPLSETLVKEIVSWLKTLPQ